MFSSDHQRLEGKKWSVFVFGKSISQWGASKQELYWQQISAILVVGRYGLD